jgi:hypothetical protein
VFIGILAEGPAVVGYSRAGPSHYAANFLTASMSLSGSVKFNPEDLVRQTTAARMRGVSKQAIEGLVKRGKLTKIVIDGYAFVLRSEVENYKPSIGGRPKQAPAKKT